MPSHTFCHKGSSHYPKKRTLLSLFAPPSDHTSCMWPKCSSSLLILRSSLIYPEDTAAVPLLAASFKINLSTSPTSSVKPLASLHSISILPVWAAIWLSVQFKQFLLQYRWNNFSSSIPLPMTVSISLLRRVVPHKQQRLSRCSCMEYRHLPIRNMRIEMFIFHPGDYFYCIDSRGIVGRWSCSCSVTSIWWSSAVSAVGMGSFLVCVWHNCEGLLANSEASISANS